MPRIVGAIALGLLLTSTTVADEYRAEPLKEKPPADDLSAEVAGLLADEGIRVVEGESRVMYDFWFCKPLAAVENFEPTGEHLYPFTPGQLIGVVRIPRRTPDFREQDLGRGVYTLRYALQPVDGAHVGTSATRDFLLLVEAEVDTSAKPMDYMELIELSSQAADAAHPAMLCMRRVVEKPKGTPAMRHDAEPDWWSVQLETEIKAGEKTSTQILEVVVVGHAAE